MLAAEHDHEAVSGGLQDRVVQVYEGVVSMDFSPDKMQQVYDLVSAEAARIAERRGTTISFGHSRRACVMGIGV